MTVSSIGWPIPPRVTMTTFALQLGDVGVGQIEDTADAGVARAFTEHEVLLPSHPVEGLVDALDQGLEVGRLQVLAGEVGFHRDGRHVHQRAVQSEDAIHDHGVFVDLLLVDFHEALTHGLDVAHSAVALLQGRQESERGGGLAVILASGRDEDTGSQQVLEHGPKVARGGG